MLSDSLWMKDDFHSVFLQPTEGKNVQWTWVAKLNNVIVLLMFFSSHELMESIYISTYIYLQTEYTFPSLCGLNITSSVMSQSVGSSVPQSFQTHYLIHALLTVLPNSNGNISPDMFLYSFCSQPPSHIICPPVHWYDPANSKNSWYHWTSPTVVFFFPSTWGHSNHSARQPEFTWY